MATTRKQTILMQVGRATFIALAWAVALTAVAALHARAQTFKSLYSFTGGNDGGYALGPLIWDKKGNLYGTAAYTANGTGNGSVYKLSKSGKLTVLYDFPGQGGNGQYGAFPEGGLFRDTKGNLYGVTDYGGQNQGQLYGVVFEVSPAGNETVLHYFAGAPNDGNTPFSGPLLQGPSRLLYQTTSGGGDGKCRNGLPLCGAVFAIDTAGNETIIHNFQGGPADGLEPWGNLVQDSKGNLYGTAMGGGDYPGTRCGGLSEFNCGAIFKLSRSSDGSWTGSLVYSFTGGTDGWDPFSLAIDAQGNLYGAALYGADDRCQYGCGTVYKLDPGGTFTVLHTFTGGSDGNYPGGVLLDAAGNLYGSAVGGDTSCRNGCGLVFKVDPSGNFTVLHAFKGSDGAAPGYMSLDQRTGILYGTTAFGGTSNWGTIFELAP